MHVFNDAGLARDDLLVIPEAVLGLLPEEADLSPESPDLLIPVVLPLDLLLFLLVHNFHRRCHPLRRCHRFL